MQDRRQRTHAGLSIDVTALEKEHDVNTSPQWQDPQWQESPVLRRSPAWNDSQQEELAAPLQESLDTFAALEDKAGGVLDFDAAAAVPKEELRRYLQASQMDTSLIPELRKASHFTLSAGSL